MKVRGLKQSDLSSVKRILKTLHSQWFSKKALKRILADIDFQKCLVAEKENKVVGFILVYKNGKAEIGWTETTSGLKEKHLGKKLLKRAKRELKKSGVRSLTVKTVKSKQASGFRLEKKPGAQEEKNHNRQTRKKDLWLNLFLALLLFFSTLLVYLKTLSHSLYFADSTEYITVAKILGIGHPSGYPLYILLAHLFTYLPFGNLPFKVNLFSAVTTSLSAVVVYLICLKLTGNHLASISASLFLSFSYLVWLFSLVAEVRSLNMFFVALIILISLHLFEKPSSQRLFWLLSFVFGLSLSNHPSILFLLPALIFLGFLGINRSLFSFKNLAMAGLFLTFGLLPYAYLPIRAIHDPLVNWGDPDSLGRFLHFVLRRDFGDFSLGVGTSANPFNFDVLLFYFSSLIWHFLIIGTILAILGLIFGFKGKESFFLLLVFVFLGPIFIFLTKLPIERNIYAKGVLERFFIPSHLVFGIWIGLGIHEIVRRVPKFLNQPVKIIGLVFLVPLIFNFSKVDQSKNFILEDYGQQVSEILPQNSVVLTKGSEHWFVLQYLQAAQGQRTDLKNINLSLLKHQWYKDYLKKLYPDFSFPYDLFQSPISKTEIGQRICQEFLPQSQEPVFIESSFRDYFSIDNQNCVSRPYKNIWKLEKKPDQSLQPRDLVKMNHDLLDNYETFWQPIITPLSVKRPKDYLTRALLLQHYSYPLKEQGYALESAGLKDEARQFYQGALEISPDNDAAL